MAKMQEQQLKLYERMMELSQVDYVAQHLRRYGVGGYLVTASERITEDVGFIERYLGLSTDEAIEYLKTGIRGLKPKQQVADRHSLAPESPEGADPS